MPEECTVSYCPVTPAASWWDLHHANSISSWSNGSCEDDVSVVSTTSFPNASTNSAVTTASSHRFVDHFASQEELIGDHASSSNHLWSHVLLNTSGSTADYLQENTKNFGESMINHSFPSKCLSTGAFLPARDNYLKKVENSSNWGCRKQMRYGFSDRSHGMVENDHQRLSKLSNMVNNWSIAPPNPDMKHHFYHHTPNISLCSSLEAHQYSDTVLKHTLDDSTCYGHRLNVKNEEYCDNLEESANFLRRSENKNCNGYHDIFNSSTIPSQYFPPYAADGSSLDIRLARPLMETHSAVSKPCSKSFNLSEFKKQRMNVNEAKKKRSDEMTDEVSKKPKNGISTALSAKEPKAKLRDKITTLQQIVSPFGKTDTASVLQEAIGYIKFLQEQVKLLTNPYMKNHSIKDPWGGWVRNHDSDADSNVDLQSRGLCLVPTSCTPQVYQENTGADYWSPTYRGCLYR